MEGFKERFYDEIEEESQECLPCSMCERFRECDLIGHEGIGYCTKLGEFFESDDCGECDWFRRA